MQLAPHYGPDPLITLDGSASAIAEPLIRQRRRLAETVAAFTEDQWNHPSRCDAWTNRDVIVHLETVNRFWSFSIAMGIKGEPTQFLATFDPVASPAQMVAADTTSAIEVCERFVASTDDLAAQLGALTDAEWNALAEAPPGHLTVSAVAHHGLWDSWIHERDILLPLGIEPAVEADEVAASLRYVVALSPAFAVNYGSVGQGSLAVEATDPDVSITVEVTDHVHVREGSSGADFVLTGSSVDLLDALSIRRPLDQEIPTDSAWMINGLFKVFDTEPV